MYIISDIKEVKKLTRRGQRKTVIAELQRRGTRFEIGHVGWPVVYIDEVSKVPSEKQPNWEGLAE